MNRPLRTLAIVLLGTTLAMAQGGHSPLLPPNANFRGESFTDWNVQALEWEIATGLGGEDLPDSVGNVQFLPGNFAGDVFNIHLDPGTAFVLPAWPVFGEMYDNGTQDDPHDPILPFLYTITTIDARLDGNVVLQGLASDFPAYSFGPVVLDHPIYYAQPQPRGPGLNSIAAIFVLGIGSVYHPLPVGQHTLAIDVQNPVLGNFHTTYNITVSPR